MAGDWFPVSVDLPYKPEIARMAELLRRSPDEIVGMVIRFWAWAQAHTPDGMFPGCTVETLAKSARVPASFLRGMVSVAWLHESADGVTIPHFDRWFSKGAKRRLSAAQRMAEARSPDEGSAELFANCSQNVALRAQQNANYRREEKRRTKVNPQSNGESIPGLSPPLSPPDKSGGDGIDWDRLKIPDGLDTPEMRNAISEWLAYRAKIRKPYRDMYRQIGLLIGQYGAEFPKAVSFSIAQGYQGCFLPSYGGRNHDHAIGPGQRAPVDTNPENRGW